MMISDSKVVHDSVSSSCSTLTTKLNFEFKLPFICPRFRMGTFYIELYQFARRSVIWSNISVNKLSVRKIGSRLARFEITDIFIGVPVHFYLKWCEICNRNNLHTPAIKVLNQNASTDRGINGELETWIGVAQNKVSLSPLIGNLLSQVGYSPTSSNQGANSACPSAQRPDPLAPPNFFLLAHVTYKMNKKANWPSLCQCVYREHVGRAGRIKPLNSVHSPIPRVLTDLTGADAIRKVAA